MNKRSIAVAVIIMTSILGIVHFVTYEFFVTIFANSAYNAEILLTTRIVFVILGLSFISSFFLSRFYNNFFSKSVARISSVWMGFLVYFFFAACIYGITLALSDIFFPGYMLLTLGKILLALAVCIGLYGLYTAHTIVITKYSITLPHVPASWKGRKAVFISDVHLGQIHGERFAEKVVKKVQAFSPDIIFNGGDMYDGVTVNTQKIIKPFETLKAPLGSYFVMGNHEEFEDNSKYFSALSKAGITVLNNEKIMVDGVQIVGVDYKTTTKKDHLETVLKNISIDSTQPSILLKHVPLNLEIAEAAGISLQLGGHTHRAQIFPFMLLTKRMYKGFDYGLKSLRTLQVLTTSGVGTWGPPFRVGTKSEIILITFN